ncbi:unnamed protein product [Cylicocyclus nassatus]|uniref:Tc1-like transposase DDE domain-containing protein n=1 Tax=Cylicocyclus nassatus TaxID=53992 RepID=A0AA36H1D5_CYLNA|nr:unnamed protein product [Cylicocyclus nassatus]
MKNWAGEKRVTLIMDNASYHSRQIAKIPSTSSTKAEIAGYLSSKGVTVRNNVTKAVLLDQLHDYIEARGGRDALREYAVDRRCAELGVSLIRLPPFHCTFNPIEKCWSQLKAHLTKYGKVTDKIDTVRARAVEWMRSVPPSFTSAWFRFARKEEAAARSKEEIDRAEESSSDDTYESSEEVEEEEDQEDELE